MNHYNELSRKIFFEYAKNEKAKNVCISTDCVALGFVALYFGTGGVTRQRLDNKRFLQFVSIPRTQKSKSSVTGITLLYREDINALIPQFERNINKYCSHGNFLHCRIKSEESDTYEKRDNLAKKINKYFEVITNGAITQIVDSDIVNLYSRGPVTFICKTKFTATWDRPFDSTYTDKNGKFFVMSETPKQVEMMIDNDIEDILVSSMENELKVTAIKLPYKKNLGDSYIAIMPNRVATKEDLLKLFSSLDLSEFLSSFDEEDCYHLGIPKYTTETDLLLDDGTPNEGLANIDILTDFRGADFSNMFNDGIPYECLNYYVKTIVTVNEIGTQVEATFDATYYDGEAEGRKIELNKPFLYLIVDSKNHISTIGTFMGPE